MSISILVGRVRSLAVFFLVIGAIAVAGEVTTAADVRLDPIALTGQPAPGFDVPVAFSSRIDQNWSDGFFEFRSPYINNAGQVLFGGQAYAFPSGGYSDHALWTTAANDELRLVMHERMDAPGTNAEFGSCADFRDDRCTRPDDYRPMEILGLSDAGEAVFAANLSGPEISLKPLNHEGIWSERGAGGLDLVARIGDPAPGTGDVFGRIYSSISYSGNKKPTNGAGLVTFHTEQGHATRLWVEQPDGSMRSVAVTGAPAPGLDGQFVELGYGYLDGVGRLVFSGTAVGPGDTYFGRGIWRADGDQVVPVLLPGDSVPNVPNREFWEAFPLWVSDSGRVAFRSSWRTSADQYGSGLYATTQDGIRTVVSSGELVPDLPGSRYFVSFGEAVIDDQDRVAFEAEIGEADVTRGRGIFAERDTGLKLIAGYGLADHGALPGLLPNEQVQELRLESSNASGQLAFVATFGIPCENPNAGRFDCVGDVPGYIGESGEGFWLVDHDDTVSLAIRSGDIIEVAPGDRRTVYLLRSFLDLNDQGQIAFAVQFLDGSQGVFRASLVPEPSSLLLSCCALLALQFARGRQTGLRKKGTMVVPAR